MAQPKAAVASDAVHAGVVEQHNAAPPLPLPALPLAVCLLSNFGLAIFVTMPFTLLVFIVRGFYAASSSGGGGSSEAGSDVSAATGFLAALSNLGSFVTALPWGLVTDRAGRRPVLVLGNAAQALSILALGLVDTYGAAAACRFLGGLANGTLGAIKSVLADVSDAGNAPRAFALLSVAWGAGAMAGPALGGALAQPCDAEAGVLRGWAGTCAPGALMARRPFLLPCAVAAALLAASAALAWAMAETMPQRRAPQRPRDWWEDSDDDGDGDGCGGCGVAEEGARAGPAPPRLAAAAGGGEGAAAAAAAAPPPAAPPPASAAPRWLRTPQCVLSLAGYASACLLFITLDELVPLWASSPPPAGGLGFTPQSLAPPLVAGGAAVLAFTLFAYPPAVARVGLEASCSAGFAATLIACAALPACAWLPGGGAQAAGLAAALCVRGAGAVAVFTAAMLLVNSNAPPGQLGEAAASLVRGLGPAIAGVCWGAASAAGRSFRWLPFGLVAAMIACSAALFTHIRFPPPPPTKGRGG